MSARIAAEPLLSKLEAVEGLVYREPTLGRAMIRGRTEGSFTIRQADKLAVKVLHLHPATVYGDEWWQAAS